VPKTPYAVIMAGGRGERFWPLSNARHPKQVLPLIDDRPMIIMAVDYLQGVVPPDHIFVITSQDLVPAIAAAVPQIPSEQIIGEPVGRDTAAVCALASVLVRARDPDGVFCILTADHRITDLDVFRSTIRDAVTLAAAENCLITIGIRPLTPSTGFGYIEAGVSLDRNSGTRFFRTRRFVEKPNRETAQAYLDAGNFYWNSGMFIWSAKTLQTAFRQHTPSLARLIDELEAAVGTVTFTQVLATAYDKLKRISIDYALMEKADNIVMAHGAFGWDDVGSWPALAHHRPHDTADNVVVGDAVLLDSQRNIVFSKARVTALLGVQNLVVVQADDVTMVCHIDRAQDIKKLVQQVGAQEALRRLL